MKIKKMLYVSLTGIFLFFAISGGASAASCDDPPASCVADLGKGGLWEVSLHSGPTLFNVGCDGVVPGLGPDDVCYEYVYLFTALNGSGSKPTTVPIAFTSSPELLISTDPNQTYEPGEGDPSGFAKDIQTVFVARFPEDPSQEHAIKFYANTEKQGVLNVGVEYKNYFGACAISGPDPCACEPDPEFFTLSSTECIATSDGKYYQLTRDSDSYCIIDAWECNSSTCTTCDRQLEAVSIGTAIKYYDEGTGEYLPAIWTGNANDRCNESIIKANPWIFNSGSWSWR